MYVDTLPEARRFQPETPVINDFFPQLTDEIAGATRLGRGVSLSIAVEQRLLIHNLKKHFVSLARESVSATVQHLTPDMLARVGSYMKSITPQQAAATLNGWIEDWQKEALGSVASSPTADLPIAVNLVAARQLQQRFLQMEGTSGQI